MTDAVQAVTGRSMGHRNLKYVDYGKFAAVLYDSSSGRAVRVSPRLGRKDDTGDIIEIWKNAPEDELVRVEEVEVSVKEDDMPGRPKTRIPCNKCGEIIMDNRGITVDGKLLCRACVEGAYYRVVTKEKGKEAIMMKLIDDLIASVKRNEVPVTDVRVGVSWTGVWGKTCGLSKTYGVPVVHGNYTRDMGHLTEKTTLELADILGHGISLRQALELLRSIP